MTFLPFCSPPLFPMTPTTTWPGDSSSLLQSFSVLEDLKIKKTLTKTSTGDMEMEVLLSSCADNR